MSFRDNLQHLRATRNMTQEQLAMLVGVSRQSVTKWEAERAYPEMDKLLKLCQIFDCTLDELVQGDLTTRVPEPELSMPAAALAEDVIGYDEFFHGYARRIALGVGSCITGAAFCSMLDAFLSDGPVGAVFLGFIGLGMLLVIPAAIERSAFCKAHPYVVNFYTDEQRFAERQKYGRRLAVGICVILLAVALEAFISQWGDSAVVNMLFLMGVAAGVSLIVYASILDNRMAIENYNVNALENLSEEEIAGIVGEERASQVLGKVRLIKRTGAICGIIMLLATAVALPLMFWGTWYGDPFWRAYFWLPWMVGGLLCGVASLVIDLRG